MKRNILYTLVLLSIYLMFSSRSCEPDIPDNAIEQDSLFSEIRLNMESEFLTEQQLLQFSEKSKQKVIEFMDLLNIYLDPQMDSAYLNHVYTMLMRNFLHSDATVSLDPMHIGKNIPLNQWITKIKNQTTRIEYNTISLKVKEPFQSIDSEKYIGSLAGNFRVMGISAMDTIYSDELTRTVNLVITKTNKYLGGDTCKVWHVFLNGFE